MVTYDEDPRTDFDQSPILEPWCCAVGSYIVAMTPDKEYHYQFIEVTGALRLHPPA